MPIATHARPRAPATLPGATGEHPPPPEDTVKTAATIAKIADPEKRAKAASQTLAAAHAKAEAARQRRDIAALVMIEPFVRAVAPSNRTRAEAKAAYDAGDIDASTYYARLAQAREERAAALEAAGVEVYPADVYNLIGVARNLFVRMMARMPDTLPEFDDPRAEAKAAARDVRRYNQIADDVRALRDAATDDLLNGRSGTRMSNADVSRLTGLTTARVAQLRLGTR
jgi:hypothetical protein